MSIIAKQAGISMSVLCIADDNELDRRIVKLNLVRYPVFKHVLYLDNGRQLLNYLTTNKHDKANLPDIVLLALNAHQPETGSILDELAPLCATLAREISFYVMSASLVPGDIGKALSYAFVNDFIAKPVTKEILTAISEGKKIYNYR